MATIKSVKIDIERGLKDTSQVVRAIGSGLHTMTLERIFTDGEKSSGTDIGNYKESTIRSKKRKGRFTSNKINLRDTDKLANSYLFELQGGDALLGFAAINREGASNSEIIVHLEDKFGKIFDLTAKEEKEIDNIIEDFMDKIKF